MKARCYLPKCEICDHAYSSVTRRWVVFAGHLMRMLVCDFCFKVYDARKAG